MRILVTGAGGLVGSALVPALQVHGHTVARLVRTFPRLEEREIAWDPDHQSIATPALEGYDAVIHLAGENIASGRWTAAKKARIYRSRIQGTRLLCEALLQLVTPPQTLICASAIGYYGHQGERFLQETSPSGNDFLAVVCRDWEATASLATQRGIRVVHLRLGMVLSAAGGALAKMLFPFRFGLGGRLGNGKQYMSWITLEDVIGIITYILERQTLHGPVNAVAPEPVTNAVFTQTLGTVLRRPTFCPLPAMAARLLFGEMADALLLASSRVQPTQLLKAGYPFRYPILHDALRHLLGKPA